MQIRIKTDIDTEPLSLTIMSQFLKYEDNAEAENTLINAMISSVRILLEKRTGLTFAEKEYEILFEPDDYPYIIPVYPVISVDKVITIDYQGVESDSLVLNTGYYKSGMYEIELSISDLLNSNIMLPVDDRFRKRIKATVKAGYGHDDTETLPILLLDAMKTQVFQWYQNRDDFKELNTLGIINKAVNLFKRSIE